MSLGCARRGDLAVLGVRGTGTAGPRGGEPGGKGNSRSHPLPWRADPGACGRRPNGIRGSGWAQAFGRAASAGCLDGPLLNISQVGDGLGERGEPGHRRHRQRAVAADSGGCS